VCHETSGGVDDHRFAGVVLGLGRQGRLGAGELLLQEAGSVQSPQSVNGQDGKRRPYGRDRPVIGHFNELTCHSDTLTGELRETVVGLIPEHPVERGIRKPKDATLGIDDEFATRQTHC